MWCACVEVVGCEVVVPGRAERSISIGSRGNLVGAGYFSRRDRTCAISVYASAALRVVADVPIACMKSGLDQTLGKRMNAV